MPRQAVSPATEQRAVPAWRHEQEQERLQHAVEDYSEFGPGLNRDLRDGTLTPESQPERWTSDVAPLDRAMSRIPASMDTTRGVDWDWLPAGVDPRDLTVLTGRRMREPSFTSVSARDRPPLRFGERPILLRMHLPTGTRVLDLSRYGSSFVPERERLLPRGTSWRVHRVYRRRRQWVLECEVEP
ncbi:MAG: hypothetical protein GEV10_08720 [Streptosporangiales bacterium]|nr:hypothetical protein [Streptosporangiales bacterium]